MKWLLSIIMLAAVAHAQDDRKAIQLNALAGIEYIHSYNNLNAQLETVGIKPLNTVSFNAAGSIGILRNNYDLQAEFSSTFGNNGASGQEYVMNFSSYGLSLMFGYDLTDSWNSISFVPFIGMGFNKMQLIGHGLGDTTVTSSSFGTGDYNIYYNNTSLQFDMRLGVSTVFNPSSSKGNFRILARAYYSAGLINYSWSADQLNVTGTSGISIDLGFRFMLRKFDSTD